MSIEVITLDNGMRVVCDPMPHVRTTALGVWVDVGSRYEAAREMGVSHMLEHMAFKGTQSRSAMAIAREVENVGGYLNAYTSRSQTAYHVRLLQDDLPLGVDILGDILQRSTFAPEELERERGVILQEIHRAEDTPDDIVFDHLQSAMFPDQPLGYPILGTEETVAGFRREDLWSFMSGHYAPSRMTLIASGAVDREQLLSLAHDHFGAFTGDKANAKHEAFTPGAWGGGEVRKIKDLEQVHVTFAVPGVHVTHPDYYAWWALGEILGGGMSSRLFQEVRERRGLAYSVFAFARSYEDTGYLAFYAGVGEKEASELLPVMVGELEGVARTVTEEEVARAKAQIKSGLMMGLESPANRAETLASDLAHFGRPLDPEEVLAKVEAVDREAVARAASGALSSTAPALAAVGPAKGLEDFGTFRARFG